MEINKKLIVQYDVSKNRDIIDYNPVCWDKSIHIRLTEFGTSFRDSTVEGFIDKLTFLITVIAKNTLNDLRKNIPFNQVLLGKTDTNKLTQYVYKEVENRLYLNDDFLLIQSEVSKKFAIDMIKVFPCVNKSVDDQPEKIVGDIITECSNLSDFLSYYKINSLEDFLFDDGYSLKIVTDKSKKNPYEKFYNKIVKKKAKELSDNSTEQVDLWN